ncbi:MAG: hypothetical protein ACKVH8_24075 [Pirellulales bacterium]
METNKEDPIILERMPFLAYVKFNFIFGLVFGLLYGLLQLYGTIYFIFNNEYTLQYLSVVLVALVIYVMLSPVVYSGLGLLTFYPFSVINNLLRGLKFKANCISQLDRNEGELQQKRVVLQRFPFFTLMKMCFSIGLSYSLVGLIFSCVLLPLILFVEGATLSGEEIASFVFIPLFFGFVSALLAIVFYFPFNFFCRILGGLKISIECFKNLPEVEEPEATVSTDSPEPSDNPYESPLS